jgi:hypothetical protein
MAVALFPHLYRFFVTTQKKEKTKMAVQDASHIESAGERANEIAVFRDIRKTFDHPPFRRLLDLMKDDRTAESVRMFMDIYTWIDDTSPHSSSLEKLGRLKQLIDNSSTRQSLCAKYMSSRRRVLTLCESKFEVG